MELLVLGLFCAALLLCIILDISILAALGFGLLLFCFHGRTKGFGWKELAGMALSGMNTIKGVLLSFLLIGMLTATWRGAGTIPVLVCYAAELIHPSVFLLATFLLNCLISVLSGTSFGTAATMGTICATIASVIGISPVLVGGAVLSGIYFGDRGSPVSISAMLVAELTDTDMQKNVRNMFRCCLGPFFVSCAVYLLIGLFVKGGGETPNLNALFGREFALSWVSVLPALVIPVLSILKVNAKAAMTASILLALPICVLVEGMPVAELPMLLIRGYISADSQVAPMMDGGGLTSMLSVTAIVCLSSTYSGIFPKTGLLDGARHAVDSLSMRMSTYEVMLWTSVATAMLSCSQALSIMLTNQLCGGMEEDKEKFALNLENSAVIVAALIPWSIAAAVPLATIGSPMSSVALAVYIYAIPIWTGFSEHRMWRQRRAKPAGAR